MRTLFIIPLVLMSLVSLPSWSSDLEDVGLICASNEEANKSNMLFDIYFRGVNNTSHTFWFRKDNGFEWFVLQQDYSEEGGTTYKFRQTSNFYEINTGKFSKTLGKWGKYQHVLKQSEDVIEIIEKRITPAEKAGERKLLSINRYNLELTYNFGNGDSEEKFLFNCEVVPSRTELKIRRDNIVNHLFQQNQKKLKKRKI